MKSSLKKSIAAAAFVLVGATSLAACGGDDATGTKPKSSESGSESTGEAAELTEKNFFSEVAKAQNDAKTVKQEFTATFSGQKMSGTSELAVGETASATAMKAEFEVSGSVQEFILVDRNLYLSASTPGKFAKLDLDDKENPLAQSLGGMLTTIDPAQQVEMLEPAVTSFKQEGEPEQLDGVEATPYVVEFDPSKVDSDLFESVPEAQLPKSATTTIYVGPDNLPRRIVSGAAAGEATATLTGWGEKVDIKAPSADQITELPGMPE